MNKEYVTNELMNTLVTCPDSQIQLASLELRFEPLEYNECKLA